MRWVYPWCLEGSTRGAWRIKLVALKLNERALSVDGKLLRVPSYLCVLIYQSIDDFHNAQEAFHLVRLFTRNSIRFWNSRLYSSLVGSKRTTCTLWWSSHFNPPALRDKLQIRARLDSETYHIRKALDECLTLLAPPPKSRSTWVISVTLKLSQGNNKRSKVRLPGAIMKQGAKMTEEYESSKN